MLESKLIELVFAGLIGAFTTMLGAVTAYLLSFSRDTRNRKQQIREIFFVIKVELEDVLSTMERKKGMQMFAVSGLELMKQKGLFDDLPPDVGAELLRIYGHLEDLNDTMVSMRNMIHGFISANNLKNFHASEFQEIYTPIRDDCWQRIKNILPHIYKFIETGGWKNQIMRQATIEQDAKA